MVEFGAPALTPEDEAMIRKIKGQFRELDKNRDGMLDFEELKEMLRRGHKDITDRDVTVLFEQIDLSKSGKVSFTEFVDYVFSIKPEVSAEGRQLAQIKALAASQEAEVWQVHIFGSTEKQELNGLYEVGETFNGRPIYDRADPPSCIFYGWTEGHKEVGWFIARRAPQQCPVKRYKMFSPSPNAELPHLCWTTWTTPGGVRDKRMVCQALDKYQVVEGTTGTTLPEELWAAEDSDDDSDQEDWEGEKALPDEDADFDTEWVHEAGEGVEDIDGEASDYDGLEDVDEEEGAEGTLWKDEDFPDGDAAIGAKLAKTVGADGWTRLSSMHQSPLLFKRVVADDINFAPDAPNGWLLSAMAAIAEYPAWIQSTFGKNTKIDKDGKYTVRLFHPGKKAFMRVTVNDLVPTKNGAPAFLGVSADGEIWAPLLEKAFAKLCTSYEKLEWGTVAYGLLYLCGGGSAESWTKSRSGKWERSVTTWKGKADDTINRKRAEGLSVEGVQVGPCHLWLMLREYMECCYPVACGVDRAKEKESGLLSDRAYSIIGCREVPLEGGILRLVRMRNPFSKGHWTGRWSDGSKAWEENTKAKNFLRFKPTPDGTFWISYTDFLKYFEHLDLVKKSLPVQGSKRAKLEGLKRGLRKFGEAADLEY